MATRESLQIVRDRLEIGETYGAVVHLTSVGAPRQLVLSC